MAKKVDKGESRPIEQLREQYLVEKELALRLMRADRAERALLYASLYDELFRRIPHHPQMIKRASMEEQTKDLRAQMRFLSPFLTGGTVFLEIGPGDCALSYEAAKYVKKVLAIDVSKEVANLSKAPDNFQLILSDGSGIPLPAESIHVAYSHQLMEHLHPDDALEQLQNLYKVLIPGGLYICITPNRLNGPHDVSMHFERVASGFHLKEYTNTELVCLLKAVGFSKVRAYVQVKEFCFRFPLFLIKGCEWLLSLLPYSLRKAIALTNLFRLLLGIRLVGQKSQSQTGS